MNKKKNIFIITGIILFGVVVIWNFGGLGGCGQAYTPAENRITGNCKYFRNTCIGLLYKKTKNCQSFFEIDTRLKIALSRDRKEKYYWNEIHADKNKIEELCLSLAERHREKLFSKYKAGNCQNILNFNYSRNFNSKVNESDKNKIINSPISKICYEKLNNWKWGPGIYYPGMVDILFNRETTVQEIRNFISINNLVTALPYPSDHEGFAFNYHIGIYVPEGEEQCWSDEIEKYDIVNISSFRDIPNLF